MQTFPNMEKFYFPEKTYDAGSYVELYFNVWTSGSVLIDISNAYSAMWILSPVSQPNYPLITKTDRLLVNGQMRVDLYSEDTKYLDGKYIQKPIIESIPNMYTYRLGQGVINFIPALGIT